ncbi:MAG: glycoside hydrolase N-terminal domain-containing protein [Akkermansia sp.]|nr:glycoside hydrolase N-terminal domain-containing protein [Akkermansia sp.]
MTTSGKILTAFLSSACAATLLAETPSANYLWYKQPAGVPDCSLPWHPKHASVSVPRVPAVDKSGNPRPPFTLFYNLPAKPAKDYWESQTLPVGNGRVGGTVFGGDHLERVNLNEVSLWSGGPNLPGNGSGYKYGPLSGKDEFGSFQPFGNLFIEFQLPEKESANYTRSLDLRDGIARIEFTNGGVKHSRECFVSAPDQVLVYSAETDTPGALSARIGLLPCHTATLAAQNDSIIMSGTINNGQQFEGRLLVRINGGSIRKVGKAGKLSVTYSGKHDDKASNQPDSMQPRMDASDSPYLEVRNATSIEILISLATDYAMDYAKDWKGAAPKARNATIMSKVAKKSGEKIRKAHIANYKKLYNRLELHLGKTDTEVSALPTDERLKAFRQSQNDPELVETIYQYGRYVLISGSRPGNLPVNLQGIWNDKVHAPWASDYHNNINLQMCYWGAEVANLSECHMPFLNFIRAMEKPLTEMTRKHFGDSIEGWTTRISQNPWGGGGWTHWNPPVNAWYALHLWDHYAYTHDKKYLKEHAYPILRNICRFWETRLKELGEDGEGLISAGKPLTADEHPELKKLKKGTLVSPEGWSHEWGPVEDGCAHDHQLIRELFDITAKAAAILKTDAAWIKELKKKRARLAPDCIGSGGYLQEWIVDRPNMVTGQRHTSHLIGVFPGSTITMDGTPDLAKAAMKSLELRGLNDDNRRSWTWPWRTALWARFRDKEQAYSMVCHYINYNLLDNLFGNHPPMQMDGTFGMTAGISEMLLQSHGDRIILLPALPEQWANGSVKGIRARGNISVSMSWEKGKVTSYSLITTDENPRSVKVIVNGQETITKPGRVTAPKNKKNKSKKAAKKA